MEGGRGGEEAGSYLQDRRNECRNLAGLARHLSCNHCYDCSLMYYSVKRSSWRSPSAPPLLLAPHNCLECHHRSHEDGFFGGRSRAGLLSCAALLSTARVASHGHML